MAKASSESFGAPDQAFVVVPHPMGMIPLEEIRAKADAAFPDLLKAATAWKPARTILPGLGLSPYPLEVIKFTGTVQDVTNMFYDKAWSIGLPFIPPTKEAVQAMLKGTSHKPDEVVWDAVPPRMGVVTVEVVAANGVMAGCKPEHMPLLLTIVQAMSDVSPAWMQWRSLTTTTNPIAPYVIVSGPIVKELGIGYGSGAAGPEMPVNLCVGYFLNLLGDVAGGSRPPDLDKSTLGWQGNTIATVIGENVDAYPEGWESLAVEKGFKPTDNVVMFGAAYGAGPVADIDHASVTPEGKAESMAYLMSGILNCYGLGAGTWVLGPEHADTLASGGWSKKDLKEFLVKAAPGIPFWQTIEMPDGACAATSCCPENFPEEFVKEVGPITPDTMIPRFTSADQIDVVVAGGSGKHSQWWLARMMINLKIDPWK